uniref:Uncharacterized protein n=1 Tax=Pseudo-nitzschia multiseries DNA virus TaxID=2364897 RepID=A0A678W4R9_9VIRU|nr:hypothetical protein PmDNAV1_gp7 [Pseudo-nitzschia multiseries DNA virus]
MFTEEQIEQAAEQVNAFIAESVNYNENHPDSLNDTFACLIDGMDGYDAENRLKEFCKENDIDLAGVEIDVLLDDLIELATPYKEHVFSFNSDNFSILSFHWQEHEICLDYIACEIGEELFDAIPDGEIDAYVNGNKTLAYVASDAIANLAVTVEQIRAALA